MQQVAKNVFVENGNRGCNPGFVVTSEGVVLIDVPIDMGDAKRWADEISSYGKIRYIITTEFHFDHNMTTGFFGGTVIASALTRDLMLEVNTERWLRKMTSRLYAKPLPLPTPEQYRKGVPTVVFSDRLTLRLGQHTFEIMLTPGHTPGQTAVYVPEEGVVFAADNVLAGGHGHLHDSVPHKWLESLATLRTLDVETIATGHGELITSEPKRHVDALAAHIRDCVEAVRTAKAQGLSVDDAVQLLGEKFPPPTMPPTEGFSATGSDPRRWVVHLFQTIGGNISW